MLNKTFTAEEMCDDSERIMAIKMLIEKYCLSRNNFIQNLKSRECHSIDTSKSVRRFE